MDANLDTCADFVFTAEGGYSTARTDAGNWYRGVLIGSDYGVSAPVLAAYLARVAPKTLVTAAYMRALPKPVATAIMATNYWNHCAALTCHPDPTC